jgi:hypothetical protein
LLENPREGVHAGRIGYFANHFVLRKIDNHDLVGMGDVKFSRLRIDRQTIPAALAADRDALDEFIILPLRCL